MRMSANIKSMLNRILLFFLCLICFGSCISDPKQKKVSHKTEGQVRLQDATGFSIQNFGDFCKITVNDPWQKSTNNHFEYYLVERGKRIPDSLNGKQVFQTPLQKVVCLSTTHIGFLDALGKVSSIVGLSGTAYLTNADVKRGITENRIHEVGNERGINYERIMQLQPDVVFAYGVGSEISAQINKLHDLGIPVVMVGEYLEQSPLAKTEWIKFFGEFYGLEATATTTFDGIQSRYNAIKTSVAGVEEKPAVLTGLPFKDTWWMAGGQSNLAVLIADAGGKFLWNDNLTKEAFPVSLEEVFLRAVKADFWINCGSAGSLNELLAFDQRFSELPAVKKSNVYNNNLRSTAGGGNDYWESGVVHPDLVLSDLVAILHPAQAAGKEFYYYRKLN